MAPTNPLGMSEVAYGLLILCLTVVVVVGAIWFVILISRFEDFLRWKIFHSHSGTNPLIRIILFPLWLPLGIVFIVVDILAILCAIDLARQSYRWFTKD